MAVTGPAARDGEVADRGQVATAVGELGRGRRRSGSGVAATTATFSGGVTGG